MIQRNNNHAQKDTPAYCPSLCATDHCRQSVHIHQSNLRKTTTKNAHANSGANNITQPSTETQPIDNRENPAEATPQSQPTCPSELQPTITSPVGKPTFPTVAPVMTTCSHVYEKIIVDPTCEKDGLCISACILCGLANASDLVPSLGHEFTFYTSNSDASCLTDGTKTSRCSRCDATDTMADVGSALGHSYSIWAICKPATCTEAGERKKTCSRCSFRKTEMISALGHADEPLVAKPTCTTAGYTTHICARCHRSYTDNSTPATGHLYGDWTIIQDPTEEENGYKKRACAFCSAVESQPIPALPHTHDYNTAVKNHPALNLATLLTLAAVVKAINQNGCQHPATITAHSSSPHLPHRTQTARKLPYVITAITESLELIFAPMMKNTLFPFLPQQKRQAS